jgi:hypothetical protein
MIEVTRPNELRSFLARFPEDTPRIGARQVMEASAEPEAKNPRARMAW